MKEGTTTAALQYLETNPVLHIGIIEPIRLDTADILYASNDGVFIREKKSNAFFLTASDLKLGNYLLAQEKNIALLCTCQARFVDFAVQKFQFRNILTCRQCVYQGEKRSVLSSNLEIRSPTAIELEIIKETYHKIPKDEIDRLAETGNLYVGILGRDFVGFVGRHLEGSIGLLNVFPEFQGHGYGTILESYLIDKLIDQGSIPYCQVEVENQRSINFHQKLGFRVSTEKLYWMF